MSNIADSINQRTKEFNSILQSWVNFYDSPIRNAIKYLYILGHTQKEVSRIVGFSEDVISQKYPKKKLLEEIEEGRNHDQNVNSF